MPCQVCLTRLEDWVIVIDVSEVDSDFGSSTQRDTHTIVTHHHLQHVRPLKCLAVKHTCKDRDAVSEPWLPEAQGRVM